MRRSVRRGIGGQSSPWLSLGDLATAQFLVVLGTSIVSVALP